MKEFDNGCNSLPSLFLLFKGKWVHANQDPGRLLLLCVWPARIAAWPRQELREDGPGYVWGHQVKHQIFTSLFTRIFFFALSHTKGNANTNKHTAVKQTEQKECQTRFQLCLNSGVNTVWTQYDKPPEWTNKIFKQTTKYISLVSPSSAICLCVSIHTWTHAHSFHRLIY